MRKGFLLGTPKLAMTTLVQASAASATGASAGIDNLLAAASVRAQLASGLAKPMRIEADFVTCSQ